MEQYEIKGLRLPPLMVQLLQQGRWQHPGDESIRRLIPFFQEPVNFLTTVEAIWRESRCALADNPRTALVFQVARGSESAEPIHLPWLDVELAVSVAVNRFLGDDLLIVLDYRTGAEHPRVVANDWHSEAGGCVWREVAPSFPEFARLLEVSLAEMDRSAAKLGPL